MRPISTPARNERPSPVTTRSPTCSFASCEMKRSLTRVSVPTAIAHQRPRCNCAVSRLVGSLISSTFAESGSTSITRPTTPSPVITPSSVCTRSLAPRSIVITCSAFSGSKPMTLAANAVRFGAFARERATLRPARARAFRSSSRFSAVSCATRRAQVAVVVRELRRADDRVHAVARAVRNRRRRQVAPTR